MKKKVFKILIITFLALNIPIIYVHSETLNLIEEKLKSAGYTYHSDINQFK